METIDLKREERRIIIASNIAFLLTIVSFIAGYHILPAFFTFPTDMTDRLVLAVHSSVFLLLWVLIAVGVISHRRRKSVADVRGSAFGPPSPSIAIWVAFLQNTLEQTVLLIGAFFAIATLLSGPALSVIPVSVVLFGIGRTAFLRGYPKGAGSRAFGMALTMMPAILGYPTAIVLILLQLFG